MKDFSNKLDEVNYYSSVNRFFGNYEAYRNFPSLTDFYKMSSIRELDKFYEGCFTMAMKTSNNQTVIDNLPFNTYLKLQKALNKYIEAENKQNGESPEMSEHMKSYQEHSASMMNQMKSSFKLPKMKI